MATIVIKDLPDSIELDRQAMSTITGGSRAGGRPSYAGRPVAGHSILRNTRIVNFPTGYASGAKATGRTPSK